MDWENSYQKLKRLYDIPGHLRKTASPDEVKELLRWLDQQKRQHILLEPEQIRKLLGLGVTFPGNGRHNQWYHRYFEVLEYIREHGEFPRTRWIEWHRTQYAKGNLSTHRVKFLQNLGIVWKVDLLKKRAVFLKKLLSQLKEFKDEHGHCKVPWDYPANPALAHYVGTKLRKRENLPPEVQQELEKLGFVWDRNEDKWQQYFSELKEYLEHFQVYPTITSNRKLARWVQHQRNSKERLSEEKINRLSEIGLFEEKNRCRPHSHQPHITE